MKEYMYMASVDVDLISMWTYFIFFGFGTNFGMWLTFSDRYHCRLSVPNTQIHPPSISLCHRSLPQRLRSPEHYKTSGNTLTFKTSRMDWEYFTGNQEKVSDQKFLQCKKWQDIICSKFLNKLMGMKNTTTSIVRRPFRC